MFRMLHAGAEVLGGALMLLFFVTIGAAAGSPKAILGCGWLAGFMIVQLGVHLVVVLGIGKLAGLSMQVSHAHWALPRSQRCLMKGACIDGRFMEGCSKLCLHVWPGGDAAVSDRMITWAAGAFDSIKCSNRWPWYSSCNGIQQGVGLADHACSPDRLPGLLCGHPHRPGRGGPPPAPVAVYHVPLS